MGAGNVEDARYIAEVAVRLHELERKEVDREARLVDFMAKAEANVVSLHSRLDEISQSIDQAWDEIRRVDSKFGDASWPDRRLANGEAAIRGLAQEVATFKLEIASSSRANSERAADLQDFLRRLGMIEEGIQQVKKEWERVSFRAGWVVALAVLLGSAFAAGMRW